MTTSGYSAYWTTDSVPEFQTVDSTVLARFRANEYNINEHKENSNAKCVSTLLNTNNWKKYLDNENETGKAESAIGSPTVEMWMDSWNNLYENVDGKLYRKASTDTTYPGYYVGINPDPTDLYYISASVMSSKKGYNNKLYYTHLEKYNGIAGYWLTSTSAYDSDNVFRVFFNGSVSYDIYGYKYLGLRPVVSLKSGTTVNAEDAD